MHIGYLGGVCNNTLGAQKGSVTEYDNYIEYDNYRGGL